MVNLFQYKTKETQTNKINRIFGLIFSLLGILFIYHSVSDFFTYNFTNVLFVVMRSNSSMIAEFIFGILLTLYGVFMILNNKNWLNSIRVLTISVISNIMFSLMLRILSYKFDLEVIIRIALLISFSFGIYKLTKYLTRINNSEWNIKTDKMNLIIGISIGLFPYIFRNIFF